ncbi:hypothetical protein EK21DRAFT_92030 [Setomelanomma holmii]|uniref:Uncharacterized protein n=1 Tax=Setomelanomma holmii TaxID=210430 RepID=A0A9P4H441_9PLEO|nr:hypothetical protein EK21DRAFT_92030 [Setomelanomma holmii]
MKLTNIITLLATVAATSVRAAPSSSVDERQALIGYIRFYAGTGCEEPWIEDTVFQQGDKCLSNDFTGTYGSFKVIDNSFTRTIRLFANPVCNGFGQGNYIDVAPGQTGCFAGKITSYSFL